MTEPAPDLPLSTHSLLVARTTHGPMEREWTGNGDDRNDHHGLIDFNEAPCYLALYWKRAGRTVHVGSFKINLRRLAKAGFVREEGRKGRLRFLRGVNDVVSIQLNEESPKLEVGRASFD